MWIVLNFYLAGFLLVNADHWVYPPEAPNGEIVGVENWDGECLKGRRQSPVDLAESVSVMGKYPPLVFTDYFTAIQTGKVKNTGHSIQIDIPANQKYLMTGGGLPGLYQMDQMHFHWSSEHTINKKRFGLELHVVSHDTVYKNFSQAVKHKNGVAVLGILFHVSDKPNASLKNILDSTDPIKNGVGSSTPLKLPLAPGNFLPAHIDTYFRYEGSLTTPTCDEAVIWTILTDSVPFEMHQIERFQEVKDSDGSVLTHNFRTLQNLNARPLVYVNSADEEDEKSSANPSIRFAVPLSGIILFYLVTFFKL